jgi:hypothetical protein
MLTPEEAARVRAALPRATPEERERLEALLAAQHEYERLRPWAAYRYDPVGYARNVLGIEYVTAAQQKILRSVHEPPYRTKVDSGHKLGKSLTLAVLVNYWYDSFDPGVVISTAPRFEHVVNILWAEVRLLRARAKLRIPDLPMDFKPSAPELRTSEDHYALGLTADRGEAFQGRHRKRMLFIFDEDEGLPQIYYTTTKTMFKGDGNDAWVSVGNPTTRSSAAYLETSKTDLEGARMWRHIRMSALDHPNIAAQLRGEPPPVPAAVSLTQLNDWIVSMCEPLREGDQRFVTDFEFPPASGRWWRPGQEAQSRILGLRPTGGTDGVWSDALWTACEELELPFPDDRPPEIGCDVARVLGGDDCDTHVRWGGVSLHHETANGRPVQMTAQRLRELAHEWCEFANRHLKDRGLNRELYPTRIPVKVDDGGVGGAVVDLAGAYRFVPVNAGSKANADLKYPNKRSELWFDLADRARLGMLSLKRLSADWREKLKVQALSTMWSMDAAGRRVVERKEITKQRLGRSPDRLDAMNLAYTEAGGAVPHWVEGGEDDRRTMGARLGTFGRETPRRPEDREQEYSPSSGLWGRGRR